jgi:hypothetical protein
MFLVGRQWHFGELSAAVSRRPFRLPVMGPLILGNVDGDVRRAALVPNEESVLNFSQRFHGTINNRHQRVGNVRGHFRPNVFCRPFGSVVGAQLVEVSFLDAVGKCVQTSVHQRML